MSIRTVHLAFIVASVSMAVVLAAWFLSVYREDANAAYLIGAILSGGAGVMLMAYGIRYRTRTQNIETGSHTWSAE